MPRPGFTHRAEGHEGEEIRFHPVDGGLVNPACQETQAKIQPGLRAQSGLGLGGQGGYPKEATWQVTKASTYASGQGVWSVWFTPGLGYSEDSV